MPKYGNNNVQSIYSNKYEKNHLIGQIMEKNEINIQFLFQLHLKI